MQEPQGSKYPNTRYLTQTMVTTVTTPSLETLHTLFGVLWTIRGEVGGGDAKLEVPFASFSFLEGSYHVPVVGYPALGRGMYKHKVE